MLNHSNVLASPSTLASYQSQVSYQQTSQQTLNYSSSDGQNLRVTQSSSVSAAYQLDINQTGHSESFVYSRQSTETTQVSQTQAVEAEPAFSAADNILGFIEQRLTQEAAAGASEEVLSGLLEQGLAGFKQGYGEAVDILQNDSTLDATVEESIGGLYEEVVAGFAELRAQFAPSQSEEAIENTPEPAISAPQVASVQTASASSTTRLLRFNSTSGFERIDAVSTQQISSQRLLDNLESLAPKPAATDDSIADDVSEITPVETNALSQYSAQIEYGRKDRFSFTLETQDGDRVTIDARSTTIYAANFNAQSEESSRQSQLTEGVKTDDKYRLDVKGELDEAELAAVNELVGQVLELADEFYNGDINQAYEQALAVGYDQNEIASYSLSLRQVEQVSVTTAYQAFTPEALSRPSIQGVFDTIGQYTSNVVESLNRYEAYQGIDYASLINSIAEQIDSQVDNNEESSFKNSLQAFI